jgi:RES domain-containing protein
MKLVAGSVDVAGDWLRHVPHGADPELRPHPPGDNRWQRGHIVDALYFAADEDTLWAEWYRHLAEHGVPPLRQMPRDLWRVRVPTLHVADLRTEEQLRAVGLPLPSPGRKTWPQFQSVGEGLWQRGYRGLLTPSAARPEGTVLCLFLDPAGKPPVKARRPPRVVREPPAPPQGMRT